jgi:serine/threonine-protein kinase
MPAYSRAVYAPPGYLLFAKDGALLARPFDPNSMQPRGAATLVAPRVKYHEASDAAFDVSNNGVLVYREPEGLPVTRLFLRDRQGELNSPLTPIGTYRHPRFSPNGHRVVVERFESESSQPDLWLYDRERQMSSPFVTNQGLDIAPAWSSDGQHIAFSSKRGSRYDVYTKTVDETTEEQVVIGQQGDTIVEDWADGRGLLTSVFGKGLLLTPFDRSQPPTMVLPSSLSARWLSEMSGDGKWIAYTSFAGKTEVFVEPVGGTGSRWQVSADGGVEPHWREDSRELFYLTLDGVVAAVDVSTDGTRLHTGQPKYLFRANTPEFLTSNFHVTRDGQTFVVNTLIAYPHVPPVRVVVNWTRALDR